MINYFNFKQFDNEYLLTNDFGKYMFVTKEELRSMINNNVDFDSDFGRKAEENYFAFQCSKRAFADKAKHLMRESKSYLFQSTGLHIFVVTNSCNMQCVYCQAQNGNDHPHGMMDHKTAERAVDIALQSPNDYLSFEFQGGEPLSNFDTIKHIVEYTEAKNFTKQIEFNLVSNLTLLTEDIADYIKRHDIKVSTSIDGNMPVHNTNRQYRSGKSTFDDVVSGIKLLRSKDVEVGAILTTTRQSLDHAKEIVDAYVSLGLTNVFIRPLTPLGCASNQWSEIGYTPEQFVTFYNECFDYILALNRQGVNVREGTAILILPKILYGNPVNYMELRSPCGAGIGQLAYYYAECMLTPDFGYWLDDNSVVTANGAQVEESSGRMALYVLLSTEAVAEDIPLLGDADGDGVITILDATVIQRYLASFAVKNPEIVEERGDISGDGLDIIDATLIQRHLAEFTVPYEIGKPIHKDSSVEEDFSYLNNKPSCPECGSGDVAYIMYGYPLPEEYYSTAFRQKLADGEIVFGGCVIDPDSPKWHCNNCGHGIN